MPPDDIQLTSTELGAQTARRASDIGPGLAEIEARRPSAPASRPRPGTAGDRAQHPAGAAPRMSPEAILTAAKARTEAKERARRAEFDPYMNGEEGGVDTDDEDEEEASTDDFADEDLDEVLDTVDGKEKAPKEEKPKASKADAAARKRALDRLKVPEALRKHLETAPAEEVDSWLESTVQLQGQTDDAFQRLQSRLDALEAKGSGGKPPKSNAPKGAADQRASAGGDQADDLEGLRDIEPEVAEVIARRDADAKKLRAENRQLAARLSAVEARHEAEAQVTRRDMVQRAVSAVQTELGIQYPGLNDKREFKAVVVPRAKALLDAGIHDNLEDAMREAAHAAYKGVADADRKAIEQKANPLRTPVSKAHGRHEPTVSKTTSQSDMAGVFFAVKEKHPNWSPGRVKAEAKRLIGRVIPDKPFIR